MFVKQKLSVLGRNVLHTCCPTRVLVMANHFVKFCMDTQSIVGYLLSWPSHLGQCVWIKHSSLWPQLFSTIRTLIDGKSISCSQQTPGPIPAWPVQGRLTLCLGSEKSIQWELKEVDHLWLPWTGSGHEQMQKWVPVGESFLPSIQEFAPSAVGAPSGHLMD